MGPRKPACWILLGLCVGNLPPGYSQGPCKTKSSSVERQACLLWGRRVVGASDLPLEGNSGAYSLLVGRERLLGREGPLQSLSTQHAGTLHSGCGILSPSIQQFHHDSNLQCTSVQIGLLS